MASRSSPATSSSATPTGLLIGPVAHFENAIGRAEEIERTESQILKALADGRTLFDRSNYHAHVAALDQQPSGRLLLHPPR